ncbi:hypothetical protein QUA82_09935 [Microcoleus sp. F8-D3]
MPNNKYNPRDEVYVTLANGLIYIFETNVDTEERVALGLTPLPATVPANAFKGGNSPTPRRARRLTADGWNSSYVSETPETVIAGLKTAGWQIQKAVKYQGIITGSTSRAVTVYVTVRGIKYAWNMPSETRAAITDATMTALGIQVATAADIPTLVWGASVPKPAKVQFRRTTTPLGGTSDSLSTYVSQAQEDNLPAGYKLIRPRLMFPGDVAATP